MIDISYLRNNTADAKKRLQDRCDISKIDTLVELDKKRRELQTATDDLLARRKKLSSQSKESGPKLLDLKKHIRDLGITSASVENKLAEMLSTIPNIPRDNVPKGKTSADNVEVRRVGKSPSFSFAPRDYLSLVDADQRFRIDAAQKASGTRFSYLAGDAALLELALIQYTYTALIKKRFIPIFPPTLIRNDMMRAMGYIDQAGEREIFHLADDDLVLVGTSEQSIGPLHANQIFQESALPIRYASFSTCYRREAGSYGKDTKGIFRLHQFDKIEMFSFTTPEQSDAEQALLLATQEELVQGLKLPYRVLSLCAGELGNPSARTYDIECFLPGQHKGKGEYRETHSTSTCTDYQSRRLNIKYLNEKTKKKEFVHTLNGTAFAIPRTLIAIYENFQKTDGTIQIPDILQPFIPTAV